jgi:hypothetical protein
VGLRAFGYMSGGVAAKVRGPWRADGQLRQAATMATAPAA